MDFSSGAFGIFKDIILWIGFGALVIALFIKHYEIGEPEITKQIFLISGTILGVIFVFDFVF